MRGWGRSLRAKIGILLCLAALPAAAISIASAIALYDTTVELNDQALVDAARGVARRVEDETTQALSVARVIGAMQSSSLCGDELQAVIVGSAVIDAAALVDPSGTIVCSAGIDEYAKQAILQSASSEVGRLKVSGSIGASSVPVASLTGWRLAVAQPLLSPIKAAIDARRGGPTIGVVDQDWRPIASSSLPPRTKDDESPGANAEHTVRVTQDRTTYRRAVVAIARSDLYAVAFRSNPELIAQETAVLIGGVAAPLVTIALTVVAAWFGIDRLALRWIRYLRRVTEAYGSGRASVRASRLEEAPAELAALGEAFDRMANAVGERTRAAESEAEARSILLRELHHRIKNNFQLMASLISLQKRSTSAEVARALSVQERRIAAIAAAYRVSYAGGDIAPSDLAELLRDVVSAIQTPGTEVHLELPEDHPSLVLDRAIPAALLVAEIAAAGVAKDAAKSLVTIKVETGNDQIRVLVDSPARGRTSKFDQRLRNSCAMQLGADLDEKKIDGRSLTTIDFPADPATSAAQNPRLPAVDDPLGEVRR